MLREEEDECTGIGSCRVLQVVISTLYFIPVKRKASERLYAGKLPDQIYISKPSF